MSGRTRSAKASPIRRPRALRARKQGGQDEAEPVETAKAEASIQVGLAGRVVASAADR